VLLYQHAPDKANGTILRAVGLTGVEKTVSERGANCIATQRIVVITFPVRTSYGKCYGENVWSKAGWKIYKLRSDSLASTA